MIPSKLNLSKKQALIFLFPVISLSKTTLPVSKASPFLNEKSLKIDSFEEFIVNGVPI